MNEARPYNTGLKSSPLYKWNGRNTLGQTFHHESREGIVFYHDMTKEMTERQFDMVQKADCLYCEIPWSRGYENFFERAGEPMESTHRQYLECIRAFIDLTGKPAFLICSHRDAIVLRADLITSTELNGERVVLAVRNYDDYMPHGFLDNHDLLRWLGTTFHACFDFGCGYGNTFRYFSYTIGCDIDTKCLDYIRREYLLDEH
jgi:hypothetical protein